MITYDKTEMKPGHRSYCAFAGRRDGKNFMMTDAQIREKYGDQIKMDQRLPDVLAAAMGNQMYVALFATKKEMDQFFSNILACKEQ